MGKGAVIIMQANNAIWPESAWPESAYVCMDCKCKARAFHTDMFMGSRRHPRARGRMGTMQLGNTPGNAQKGQIEITG